MLRRFKHRDGFLHSLINGELLYAEYENEILTAVYSDGTRVQWIIHPADHPRLVETSLAQGVWVEIPVE